MTGSGLDKKEKRSVRKKVDGIRLFSVFAVVIMTVSALCAVTNDSGASTDDVSDYEKTHLWKCEYTTDKDGNINIAYYTRSSTAYTWTSINTTPVTGNGASSISAWYFDSSTGYGPFNSFYAAFDTNGNMLCHLNPYDLSKNLDATDSTNYANGSYNIMWVLPRFCLVTDSEKNMMTITNDLSITKFDHFAFSGCGAGSGTVKYVAYGVYAATGSSTLGSASGQSPAVSKTLTEYRDMANKTSGKGDVSVSKVWNYYQWQAYRLCALAAMNGIKDSQAQVGNGSINQMTTGLLNKSGPYSGTTSNYSSSVKLFIENAWGGYGSFIDDAQLFSGKMYAGTNQYSDISKYFESEGYKKLTKVWSYSEENYYEEFGKGTSTNWDSWGMPTGSTNTHSSSAPDWIAQKYYTTFLGVYYPNALVLVGGYGQAGDADAMGLSSVNSPHQGTTSGSNINTRLVYMLTSDGKEVDKLTISSDNNSTILGSTTYLLFKNTTVSLKDGKLTFKNTTGTTCTVEVQAKDGYRMLGLYKDGSTFSSFKITSDTNIIARTQPVTILTVGTDGGGTLQEKIGTAEKATISEGQTYTIDRSSPISISGNTMTFTGYKGTTSTAVKTPVTITISATATTVTGGGGSDYRILGWNVDGGNDIIGASRNSDGTLKADTISTTNVSKKSITLDTWETVTLSLQEMTGGTLTMKSGSVEKNISSGQVFTIDIVESHDSKGNSMMNYPTVSIADNVLTLTGYCGTPGNDIVEMTTYTITAKADLKSDGKDGDYRLVGWYQQRNSDAPIAGTTGSPKKVGILGTTGTYSKDGKTYTNSDVIWMKTQETKTFYVDSKYGGSLSSNTSLTGNGPYMFTLDVDSKVTIGNGSNSFGLGEIGFKGYYGAISATKITGVNLDDQKFTAVADGDYRFWIWSSKHVSDKYATGDGSQSYTEGAHLYARFAAQANTSSVLQTAAGNSVGLIEILGDISVEQIALVKDADGLGGPYLVLKPETSTVITTLTLGDDTAVTIQSGDVSRTLSANAEDSDDESEAIAKLTINGKMSVSGTVTNNGLLSYSGEGMSIDAGGLVTNNNEMAFGSGATYVINGGRLVNNGVLSYVVTTYDQLQDAVDKSSGSTKITVTGDDVAVTGSIDIPGNDATISMLIAKDATMTIAEGGAVNFKDDCNLSVEGTLNNSGSVSIEGTVDPSDEESEKKSGYVKVNGLIDNIGGTFIIDANGTLEISSQGRFHADKESTYELKDGGVIKNEGTLVFDVDSQDRLLEYMEKASANTRIDVVDNIEISRDITVPSATNTDVSLEVMFKSGTESKIAGAGSITISDNGTVSVAGKLNNNGTITTIGSNADKGGLLKVSVEGKLYNQGRLVGQNNGRMTVTGYQDNIGGTLQLRSGSLLTIEPSGTVHMDLDSDYEKDSRATLNNNGLLVFDANTEDMINEAIGYADEVNNLGSGELRIDIVEDMKIRGKIEVPNHVNLVVTEDTTVTVRPTGRITVLDGGTLTVDGKLIIEYGGKLKIEEGGTLINNGKIIRISEDGEEEDYVPEKDTSNDSNVLAVAFGAAAVASLFALTMFMDQYKDTATVTFYSSRGGKVSRSVVRVPNGTEMMIKGRNAIFYIEGKELPQIVTADPEEGHRFDIWNLYDQDDGSWYPSKGHSLYGDEKSFFIVGKVEVDAMFAEGGSNGVRAVSFESRVMVTKGTRDPDALADKHEDRIGADEF